MSDFVYPYGPHERYDLVHDPNMHDPDESQNLVDDVGYQPQQSTIRARLEKWFVYCQK